MLMEPLFSSYFTIYSFDFPFSGSVTKIPVSTHRQLSKCLSNKCRMKYAYGSLAKRINLGASDLYGNLKSINLTDSSNLHVRHRQTAAAESLNKNDPRHFRWTFTGKSPPYLMPFSQ